MLIFEKEQVKKATHLNRFTDFINEIAPLYEAIIPFDVIAIFPWDDIQKILSEYIITGLRELTDSAGQSPDVVLPDSIKGVYFCLADDARHFSIHGSLYYNEIDWAAQADYDYKGSNELFTQLSDALRSLSLSIEVTQDLLYLFAAFTLLKTLRKIDSIPDVANAAMTLGYSCGDILILGRFIDQAFHEQIEIVIDGEYENPSTAPVIAHEPTEPRGDLWHYMDSYSTDFIRNHGLTERFYKLGEAEAVRISEEFKSELILNQCPLCNAIKKTPRARFCLKCGEFTEPRVNPQ
ncbi:hypothetical protein [Legionella sp. CNM-4043-24]|uniref:hypothetical protein n=1 Tax=Legionella sp. CNM-4043-24 TaxID=3421646 RepID=UPI00403B30E1